MKNIELTTITETCATCGTNLIMEKVTWTEMQGSLYSAHCPKCKIHGESANCESKALDKFDKKRKQRERQLERKPEKILTDIRDYLETEKSRIANSDILILQIKEVEKFADKAIAYLTEYAEKLGVEL